jgi:hypothetical protein
VHVLRHDNIPFDHEPISPPHLLQGSPNRSDRPE